MLLPPTQPLRDPVHPTSQAGLALLWEQEDGQQASSQRLDHMGPCIVFATKPKSAFAVHRPQSTTPAPLTLPPVLGKLSGSPRVALGSERAPGLEGGAPGSPRSWAYASGSVEAPEAVAGPLPEPGPANGHPDGDWAPSEGRSQKLW